MTLVRLPVAPLDFRRAHTALVRATKLSDVVRIRDSAEAVRVACSKAKAGLAIQNQAAEIRLRAERKAGQMLADVERSEGGRPSRNAAHRGPSFRNTLKGLDLALSTAKRWQEEARISEDRFERYLRGSADEELTSAGLLRAVRPPFVPVVTIRDDRIMTPLLLARAIVKALGPTGMILEPFAGDGSFVKALRPYGRVRWCEIDRGRDFFAWKKPVDWIVSNPPWSQFRTALDHALTLADHVVFLVTVNHWWTQARVRIVRDAGFGYRHLLLIDTPDTFRATGFAIGAMHLERGYDGPLAIRSLPCPKGGRGSPKSVLPSVLPHREGRTPQDTC